MAKFVMDDKGNYLLTWVDLSLHSGCQEDQEDVAQDLGNLHDLRCVSAH